MPKHPNNRSWPENLAFDFELPMLSPAAAEAFISTLPTTERNKEFLRLRYRDGKTYTEIAAAHGMTPPGVRLATIAMQEKFGGEAISTQVTAVENVVPQSASTPMATPPPAVVARPPVEDDATKETSRTLSINLATVRRLCLLLFWIIKRRKNAVDRRERTP